jgi:hypothetical protein
MNFTGNTFNTGHQQQHAHQEEDDSENELSEQEIIDIINSYAAFRYEEPEGAKPAEAANCAICIDVLKTGQMVKALQCTHKFHSSCINTWLKQKLACPLCKQSVI